MASILINSVFNTQVSKTHYVNVYTVYNHGPPAVTWPNWMRTNIPMTPFVNGFKKKTTNISKHRHPMLNRKMLPGYQPNVS